MPPASFPTDNGSSPARKPLRLWPGIVLVCLQWLARFVLPLFLPETMPYAVMGALAAAPLVVVWWVFFSRAPAVERWGALVLMVAALFVTPRILHESVATGAMGMLFFIYAIPGLCLAFVAWAVLTRNFPDGIRRVTMVLTIVLACAGWALVKTGGFSGDLDSDFAWRWAPTAEDRLVAETGDQPVTPPASLPIAETGADWPGFRGPGRDGIVHTAPIATDWSKTPPVELWRRPVGPGWSSFAVHGDVFFTQEQRGDEEAVTAYRVSTGEPLWRHADATRFWESNAGAGPRSTPTLSEGRVYTLGANGLVNALEELDGSVVWSRDAASDSGAELPTWGFSGSPLVTDDLVIVAASGNLVAYDLATGEPRWTGPEGGTSYSSPHLLALGGVPQVVQLTAKGVFGVLPADGTTLWQHPWPGYPIVQPAQTAEGDLLIAINESSGLRRLAVSQEAGNWTATERWTSIRLKPYFDDFVVHKGHAYGFDGRILACIDVDDGRRNWKGGRYGNGQLILLADQDVLLVLSEDGDLALVRATPEGFAELGLFPALQGKTWNHPVLADDILLVRNGEEMAAFRLPLASG